MYITCHFIFLVHVKKSMLNGHVGDWTHDELAPIQL